MKTRSGFQNLAADKIWNDHLGNNEYTRHRDQCEACSAACKANNAGQPYQPSCSVGKQVMEAMLDRVYGEIDDVLLNHN